jgi:3-dehydroquinate synthase
MPIVNLNINEIKIPVVIGSGIEKRLTELVSRSVKNNTLFIIYDANVYALYGNKISKQLKKNRIIELVIPSGEKSKSSVELNKIYNFLLSHNISRSDLVLGVGGGMISDLAGYASATILRGVPYAILSTSLLGMVDASIGGKTAINHSKGKNLIGTFFQPRFVVNDLNFLSTLPEREFISGFAEILKYGGLIGNDMLKLIDNYIAKNKSSDYKYLLPIIKKSIEFKKSIVEEDEKEHGQRMFLNFGHTFGHAIESCLGYKKLLHGEALILGLVSAMYLSINLNKKKNKNIENYLQLIKEFVQYVPYVTLTKEKIIKALEIDKKRRNSKIKFILLDRLGKPIIRNDIMIKTVEKSVDYMISCYKELGAKND